MYLYVTRLAWQCNDFASWVAQVMRIVQTVRRYNKKKDVPLLWSALSGSCAGGLAAEGCLLVVTDWR